MEQLLFQLLLKLLLSPSENFGLRKYTKSGRFQGHLDNHCLALALISILLLLSSA